MTETLGDHLADAPFTLALSAGFFGFFAHAGALAALEAEGLEPQAFSGSSAGALVGGAAASGVSGRELFEVLARVRRQDFWDVRPGLGLLRGERFRAILRDTFRASTFDACPRPVALSAWEPRTRQVRVLDGGDLIAAVHASCAFPGLLQPVRWEGRRLIDGGVGDRAGLAAVPPGVRVLHHHLASRSPWRRAGSPALEPPSRPGLTALVIDGLPRLSPFAMERGPEAFERAFEATRRALWQPMAPLVRLSAG